MRLSRSAVLGRRGMIATGHALASAAGFEILAAGGNAIDAAVAAHFQIPAFAAWKATHGRG